MASEEIPNGWTHRRYESLNNTNEGKAYRRAADWTVVQRDESHWYWKPRKSGYVKEDGRNSIGEDYANNLEHFLFEPEKLRSMTPKVHQWINENFGDKLKVRKK